jgi:penicillin-binding protein 2
MKPSSWLILTCLILAIGMAGCGVQNPTATTTPLPVRSPTLPPPEVRTTLAPSAEATAQAYFRAWEAKDYASMYGLLTSASQEAFSEQNFTAIYQNAAEEAALGSVETKIVSSVTHANAAQITYQVILHSTLVGDIQRDVSMNLALEDGQWRLEWDPVLILPELGGGNVLRMVYEIPARGDIFDRNGEALAAQADAFALGIVPDQVDPDQEDQLISQLSRLTGIRADTIRERYENYLSGAGWYLPLASISADKIGSRAGVITGFDGVVLRPYTARFYFDGGVAPHAVGYVSAIGEDEVEEFRRRGYRVDQMVGRTGLEAWGERTLAGVNGGTLYVVDPEGQPVEQLAQSLPQPSQSITTTLDYNLQLQSQRAIQGFRGAIVVLERDTGRVLAMVSSPGFDPNLFAPDNFNGSALIQDLFDPNTTPLLNRATRGQYPLGSVFKIVTMAAALESGLYNADSEYDCQYEFSELQGVTLYDWTLEQEFPPSGLLTLPEGLMRSCNTYFYHIGVDLYRQGLTTAVSDMAQGFGLGSATGIGQIEEEKGQVPVPGSDYYAAISAVGQADLLVTPLQVADFVAAVGNGGTLYRPQVVEQIGPPGGQPSFTFKPEVRGQLPVSAQNLETIKQAMVSVVDNRRGTAYLVFGSFPIAFAGKTGTAQDTPRDPHAWFAGYTFEERPDKPDIAVAVIAENAGQGSEIAAPICKRVLEIYFYGRPLSLYPWESQIGVPRPEPEATETPSPEG